MTDYMVRIGVSSNLDDEALEDAISDALDVAGISNTVYDVLEAGDGQWTIHKRVSK